MVPMAPTQSSLSRLTPPNLGLHEEEDISSSFCSVYVINKKEIIKKRIREGRESCGSAMMGGGDHVEAYDSPSGGQQSRACFGRYWFLVYVYLARGWMIV